jgi:hypothetical protein
MKLPSVSACRADPTGCPAHRRCTRSPNTAGCPRTTAADDNHRASPRSSNWKGSSTGPDCRAETSRHSNSSDCRWRRSSGSAMAMSTLCTHSDYSPHKRARQHSCDCPRHHSWQNSCTCRCHSVVDPLDHNYRRWSSSSRLLRCSTSASEIARLHHSLYALCGSDPFARVQVTSQVHRHSVQNTDLTPMTPMTPMMTDD